ncbi:MAG: DNA replication/repair protein RecF [Oscillospiraceae bacterium]|nr:DNA replication/repair protein RecF [Oscillospiraceae bacterium]
MRLYWTETENFRLLEPQRVEFSPGVNVITGENAQGKTTLLEAVYLLTGGKSFRANYDRELIAFDKERAVLSGGFHAAARDQKIELTFARGRSRQIKLNGVRTPAAELRGALHAIIFSPDDLGLVRGPAAGRRKLMDAAISQLRPGYGALLADFGRVYENKLRILKDWREKPSLLEPLDEFNRQLAVYSARLIRYRAAFAGKLAEAAAPIHREFAAGREELAVAYTTVSTVEDPKASERDIFEAVWERQRTLRQAELDAGSCLVGAHKDYLAIAINGTDARAFASQGQTRTAALSIKLAEREIFLGDTGEMPVLLLDDVLSELDAARQDFVLNRIGGGQTLVTSCNGESVSRLLQGRVLRMEKGRVFE